MDKLDINGNWQSKKVKLQQNFAQLTEEDLQYTKGKEEALVGRIQRRLEVPKAIAAKIIQYSWSTKAFSSGLNKQAPPVGLNKRQLQDSGDPQSPFIYVCCYIIPTMLYDFEPMLEYRRVESNDKWYLYYKLAGQTTMVKR